MRDMASINCNEICPVILLSPFNYGWDGVVVGYGGRGGGEELSLPPRVIVYRMSDESRYRQ